MKIAIYIASAFWMALFLLLPTPSPAQSQRNPCYYTAANPGPGNGCIPVSSANPLPVAATATIGGGFTDAATGTPISVTTGGVSGNLPAGTVVAAFNVGTTNTAFCKLGASATTNDIAIPPASWFAFSVGASTQLTCITSTSTTTVNMVGGSGLPTGSGGGGGGSGSGGLSVTDQAAFIQGSSSFTPNGGVFNDTATLSSGQQGTQRFTTKRAGIIDVDTSGNALYAALIASTPAGTNLIGDVNLRQGGTVLSATNGIYSNLLQGNAVISSSNPLFAQLTAGSAIAGKFGIDQTTPGTTNGVQLPTTTNGGAALAKGGVGVVNGGSFYQAVAASQTATVLQSSTGATGDYLSHCVLYPTSTSPGVVTIFDNTNAAGTSAILFPGGASSLSNLVPISIPVGAISTAGAWKVTTGASISVVCYGKFS